MHNHDQEKLEDDLSLIFSVVGKLHADGNLHEDEVLYDTDENYEPAQDEMSLEEKRIMSVIVNPSPELPYALQELKMAQGPSTFEYVIPDEERAKVFYDLYPFADVPDLDETLFDLHEGKEFIVREYKVIRERNRNWLVSPFYAHSAGMVIDWVKDGEEVTAKVVIRR